MNIDKLNLNFDEYEYIAEDDDYAGNRHLYTAAEVEQAIRDGWPIFRRQMLGPLIAGNWEAVRIGPVIEREVAVYPSGSYLATLFFWTDGVVTWKREREDAL